MDADVVPGITQVEQLQGMASELEATHARRTEQATSVEEEVLTDDEEMTEPRHAAPESREVAGDKKAMDYGGTALKPEEDTAVASEQAWMNEGRIRDPLRNTAASCETVRAHVAGAGQTSRVTGEATRVPEEDAPPDPVDENPACCCVKLYAIWEPSAMRTAAGLYTSALTLLGAAVGLRESEGTGWTICLGLMGVFLIAAGVATVLGVRYQLRSTPEDRRRAAQESSDPDVVDHA